MLPNLSVERSTTVSRVAEALRKEILAGGIASGTVLRELELATTMGVSRGSVREAIATLVNEGLLSRSSYRSVVVTTLTESDVREIFQARRLIELAAVDAARGATEEQHEQLRAACEEFVQAVTSGVSTQSHEADVNVHTTLVSMLVSTRLSRIHSALMGELRLALTAQYEGAQDGATLVQRHQDFVDLISRGEIDAARAQLAERLDIAEGRLLAAYQAGTDAS